MINRSTYSVPDCNDSLFKIHSNRCNRQLVLTKIKLPGQMVGGKDSMSDILNNPDLITCSVSKAILSGSKNRSQNNLELQELQNPTQSHILENIYR